MSIERFHSTDGPAAAVAAYRARHPVSAPLLACSGGPDSLALLLAAARAGVAGLAVCHVDHRLRPGGAREAAFVRAVALAAGVPRARVRAVRVAQDLRVVARRGGRSLEEVAREARYRALARVARTLGCSEIWTGHNATDQVETLLLHLLRGAGTVGLAGMRERGEVLGVMVGRPLLTCARAAIEADLGAQGVTALVDPTNSDPRHHRNHVRHHIVPALRSLTPALEVVVGRACQNLADDAEALDSLAAALPLTGAALLAAPRALRYRALARAARAAGVALETVHLAAIEGLCRRQRGGAGVDLPGGRALYRQGVVSFVKRS
ncbi:MAG: tRNA lysidine(34) synthetase TilS [Deltaproteobacteria bacterium]|nr:tRNA lysidine(34) synthetase TilS [Deltaproteobacteria bacterium]